LEDSSFKNDLRIHLAGQVDLKVLESVEKAGLNDNLVLQEYIPHPEALSIQRSSHILLLALSTSPSAKGILTGKIFEYLAARRAILGVGPVDGDLSRLIDGLNVGQMFDYSDNRGVKTFLLEKYQDYKSNSEMTSNADISEFSRRNLTGKIIKVIEQF
jgi:hypothetical protein